MTVEYRDPNPTLRGQLYWLFIRWFTSRDVPREAYVKLSCPETDEVIATEYTKPAERHPRVEGGAFCTYDCPECGVQHTWVWGIAPAPILAEERNNA